MGRASGSPAQGDSLSARIARNTGMLFGGKLTAALVGLVVLVILGNVLPPVEFGALLLLHAYAASFSGLLSFNSWQLVVNRGVEPMSRGDWPGLHRLLRFAIALDIVGAAFAALAGVLIMPFAYELVGMPPGYLGPALAYCGLIIFNQTSAATGFLRLSDRFDLLSMQTLVLPASRLVGVSLCALMGAGLAGYMLVWFAASFLTYISLPLLALRSLARQGQLGELFRLGRWLQATEPGLWRFALFSNFDSSVKTASQHLPTLLAGAVFGPGASAIYRISYQIADLFARAVSQFDRVVHPEFARLLNDGEGPRMRRLAMGSSLVLLAIGLVIAGLLALSGADLLASLLGEAYGGAAGLIVLLLLAGTLSAAAVPYHPILYAFNRPAMALAARLCGLALFLGLVPVLAGRFGLDSLGWAAICGETLALALVMGLALRSLQRFSGQSALSPSRTDATTPSSPTPDPRSGGPGQPASRNSTEANTRRS